MSSYSLFSIFGHYYSHHLLEAVKLRLAVCHIYYIDVNLASTPSLAFCKLNKWILSQLPHREVPNIAQKVLKTKSSARPRGKLIIDTTLEGQISRMLLLIVDKQLARKRTSVADACVFVILQVVPRSFISKILMKGGIDIPYALQKSK